VGFRDESPETLMPSASEASQDSGTFRVITPS
jgi:hypothetical protein